MGWTFDPHHTIVGFSAKHLGITTVRGIFKEFNADVQPDDDGNPTTAAGRVVVKAASLDTANEQRDGHLRSADFFDVENYPDIVFVAKSVSGLVGAFDSRDWSLTARWSGQAYASLNRVACAPPYVVLIASGDNAVVWRG